MAQNTISQLERGERQAMPSTVRKLADALGVEPPVLMDRSLQYQALIGILGAPDEFLPKRRKEELQGFFERKIAADKRLDKAQKEELQGLLERMGAGWAEYYVSGKFVEVDEQFSPEQKDAIFSRIGERYLETSIPALFSYNEDLLVARSRLESNDPKATIEAAQLVLRRAKIIVEEYNNKLQSFRNLPDRYYSYGDSTIQRIVDVQNALAEQRVAAAKAVQELMDLYNECLDTLEDQIIGMRKESDELEGFVTQTPDRER